MERTIRFKKWPHYLGLHKDTVYDLVKENKLPHFKVGGRILFLEDELEKWMMENMRNW